MKSQYHVQFLNNETKTIFEIIKNQLALEKSILEEIEQALELDKRNEFIIAILDSDNKPVGIFFIKADSPVDKSWTIAGFSLIEVVRGQGLAKILHQTIAEWAKDSGASKLEIKLSETDEMTAEFLSYIGYEQKKDGDITIFQKDI